MPAGTPGTQRWPSRLTIGILTALLALFLISAYQVYRHIVDREEDRVEKSLGHNADIQAAALSAWILERLGDAHVFSSGRFLGETMHAWLERGAPRDATRFQVQEQLRAIKTTYGYLSVAVLDTTGAVQIEDGDTSASLDSIAAGTAKDAARLNSVQISSIHSSPDLPESRHIVDIAAPLLDVHPTSEKTQSILLLRINADMHFDAFVQPMPLLNAAADALVAERQGDRAVVTASGAASVYFGDGDVLPIAADELTASAIAPMKTVLLRTQDDRTVMAVVRRIPGVPWYLVSMFDLAAARANVNRLAWIVAGASMALLLVFAILVRLWWKGRESRYRLQMLQATTEKEQLRLHSQAALRESQERLNGILASILDVVWSFSACFKRLNYINQSAERIYGYPVAAFLERPQLWFDAIHADDRERVRGLLAGLSDEQPLCDTEYRIVRSDGTVRWLHLRGRLVREADGGAPRVDGVASDITERKAAEQQVQMLAYYDNVTKLPNRALLQDRLAQAMHMAQRNGKKVALFFMDLDNFKNINDSLGHQVGDMLLKAIGERLSQCVRSEDTVARIGGDEFLIVLSELDKGAQAVSVAEKILTATAGPFSLQNHQIHTTISIGIGIYPDDAQELHELVRHADSALYQAKARGRNNYQFFTQELNYQITRNATIERELRWAIDAGNLQLWYQPQIDTRSGRMIGAEALLRWRGHERQFLSPVEFIPVAEERGLISRIGEWALREACNQCRQWQEQGLRTVPLAVNVSPIQFQQKGFVELVTGILHESGLDAANLEIEITESAIMRRAPQVAELANRLREIGVGISIDDFGTGYSSLSYLKHIPIDKIKIDRSFIKDMLHDDDDEAIAYAIINLAHSLKLRVIAEGVETREQVDRLRTFGCDEVQGYFYSSAVSAPDFERFLQADTVFSGMAAVRH
ncbi:MAG TPA: EAL domain-containing protein [Noviherbaspirillum sp.]|nr:EAL domain-containing protein [Noviherbaspirillum sp.]